MKKSAGGLVSSTSKKTFLSNYSNKQRFIDMLASKLVESNILVEHSSGDADYLIALTATEKLKSSQFNLYLEASSSNATRAQWSILETWSVLGDPVISILPFIHAFWGCDTISSIFLKGKTALIRKVNQIKNFVLSYYKNDVSVSEISDMGETVMLVLYGNNGYETFIAWSGWFAQSDWFRGER